MPAASAPVVKWTPPSTSGTNHSVLSRRSNSSVGNGDSVNASNRRTSNGGKSWLAAAAARPRRTSRTGHLLHRTFHFSFVRRSFDRKVDDYEQEVKAIASVATVEEFWQVYVHLHRVSRLAPLTDYFLFQEGIRPLWEDDANRRGGRLTLRLTKQASSRAFEDLCLAFIGEQFDTDDICGIACSVRVAENFLSIWLKDANNTELTNRVEQVARRLLALPPSAVVREWTFKPHQREQPGP